MPVSEIGYCLACEDTSFLPTGELFDHGLDSWAAILLPICAFSLVGRSEWGGEPEQGYAPCLAAVVGFFLSHWEKYVTGTLYLPWFYDIMQLVSSCCGYILRALAITS